jgi:DNA-binding Lrp family transcriptional regulator
MTDTLPGYQRGSDTSKEAAVKFASAAKSIRENILHIMRTENVEPDLFTRGWTPDEIVERMGLDRCTVRPRFTELAADGIIRDTGLRRENKRGYKTTVFEVVSAAVSVSPPKKKMKPVGDPELWGKVMQGIYATAHCLHLPVSERAAAHHAMSDAVDEWVVDMVDRVRKQDGAQMQVSDDV